MSDLHVLSRGLFVKPRGEEIIRAGILAQDKLFQRGASIDDPQQIADYFQVRLGWRPHEVFAVLWLDEQSRVLSYEEIQSGTVNRSDLHLRRILAAGLAAGAQKLICSHNHPSGDCTPSQADLKVTELLEDYARLVGIAVVDHIVVGRETCSFKEKGYMGMSGVVNHACGEDMGLG